MKCIHLGIPRAVPSLPLPSPPSPPTPETLDEKSAHANTRFVWWWDYLTFGK